MENLFCRDRNQIQEYSPIVLYTPNDISDMCARRIAMHFLFYVFVCNVSRTISPSLVVQKNKPYKENSKRFHSLFQLIITAPSRHTQPHIHNRGGAFGATSLDVASLRLSLVCNEKLKFSRSRGWKFKTPESLPTSYVTYKVTLYG